MTNTNNIIETIEQNNARQFKENKSLTCGFRFSGYNKYYNAFQVADVVRFIKTHGFDRYNVESIEDVRAVNSSYYGTRIDITLNSGGCTHVGFRNTQKDFIEWCIGFNDGIRQNNSN